MTTIIDIFSNESNKLAQFDVFISHASKDKDKYVFPLAKALELRGINYWLDKEKLGIGSSISMGINEGLRRSRYVLVCLSDAFLDRSWPEAELGAAMAIQNRLDRTRVLPVILNSEEKVLNYYPLLADKLYMPGDNPKLVADVIFLLLTGPEDILNQSDIEVDAEVSDHLAWLSRRDNYSLAVEDFLVRTLAICLDDTQRYWLYYTLGRIKGSRAYSLLEKAKLSEYGFALKGVKEGLNFFTNRKALIK